MDDELDLGAEPHCPVCGTVMRTADGGYRCGGCGHWVDIPWVEAPRSDDLPGIHGG
jgi:tRNA(Ile2) C34 agmatinyltransferase TiaS